MNPRIPAPAAALAAALLALVTAAAAGAARDAAETVRFGSVPRQLVKGELAAITVAVRPAGRRCTLSIRYADGARRGLGAVRAAGGRAAWRFRVPESAAAGPARLTASCPGAGSVSRAVGVVASESGIPASVRVEQRGFSQRTRGLSSTVSYGLVLANPSPTRDAVSVEVVVNFVDASNRVVQTATNRVAGVRAGSRYHLGGSANIPELIPVVRLEVVIRLSQAPRGTLREPPTEDLRIVGAIGDPGWTGAVNGQVLNDHPRLLLSGARVSVVVFDAAGNVTGGTTGYASATLVPGSRQYFSASSGLSAVPLTRAVTAQVTVEPTYRGG